MSIPDATGPGKPLLGRIPADALIALIVLLTGTLGFLLGMSVGKDQARSGPEDGFWVEQLPQAVQEAAAAAVMGQGSMPAAETPKEQVYMASKNGTKYYLPTCGSAKRIKEENRVWFATKAEAEAAGYSAAANCKGL